MAESASKTTNYFKKLAAVNVNEHTEQKNGLTYLSWAYAWQIIKEHHPTAFYTIYENAQGFNYHTDGRTCWVKTGVTIDGLEHIEYLPVMDYRNKSIPLEAVTSTDVNKAIQRSITKACARHGLGLYLYAGSEAPDGADATENAQIAREQLKTFCEVHGVSFEEVCKKYHYDSNTTAQEYAERLRIYKQRTGATS